jgi:predicted Zn-dependent peptidase
MKHLRFLPAAIFISLCLHSQAQVENAPAPGVPRDFSLPDVRSFKLDNGMNVTFVQFGKLPKVEIRLVVRVGNIDEQEGEVWLADFTGKLMKEGTVNRPGHMIAAEAASMGSNLNVSTGVEVTEFTADVLSDFAPQMIELISDVVQNPIFPDSEEARLKNDMVRDLNLQRSQPENIAFELFSKIMFPGHPYGRIFPDQQTIESFSAAGAKKFYAGNFGAVRSHLYIAGAFKEQDVERAVRERFSAWTKGNDPLVSIPAPQPEPAIYFVDRPGTPQAVLNIGIPVVDPSNKDYLPLLLTNSMLGGSFTSRITMNIREDKGYTYSPYSRIISRYRSALWMQFAEVATDATVPSVREIFNEINRLSKDSVSNSELEGIKNYMTGMFTLSNSTRHGIISQLAFVDLHGLDIDYLRNYVKNIHAITSDDVKSMMQKYLDPAKMIIVIAGDKGRIGKEGIAKFGKIAGP